MSPLAKALRLWNTVRHLKPVQLYGRIRFRSRSLAALGRGGAAMHAAT